MNDDMLTEGSDVDGRESTLDKNHVRQFYAESVDSSASSSDIENCIINVPENVVPGKHVRSTVFHDTVEELLPEQIRWFYKEVNPSRSKKSSWVCFNGYDSLRIECKYRETVASEDIDISNKEMVLVLGGQYEADVCNRECRPIYWNAQFGSYLIMRGSWFFESYLMPVDEDVANKIEATYLELYQGCQILLEDIDSENSANDVVKTLHFNGFFVNWHGIHKVSLHYENTSSKFYRAVGNSLGLGVLGTQLQRGFIEDANMEDKPPDIAHLVFVVHGMGQKMDVGSIIRSCDELRESVVKHREKYFPGLKDENKRAEFLPVEWRSGLKLDGDIVESITPNRIRGIRHVLNASAMDILYYNSPLYRKEISRSLRDRLNSLYKEFVNRNPYFNASGGKISVLAHSLGCVIVYDILTDWSPLKVYDQFISAFFQSQEQNSMPRKEDDSATAKANFTATSSVGTATSTPESYEACNVDGSKSNCNDPSGMPEQKSPNDFGLLSRLQLARLSVNAIEEEILEQATFKCNKEILQFKIENFICLGSPLAVFLALRGVRPSTSVTSLASIVPTNVCRKMYNVFHPSDPIAYRLEPLILKHYANIPALPIHRHDSPHKHSYLAMQTPSMTGVPFRGEEINRNMFSMFSFTNSKEPTTPSSDDNTPIPEEPDEVTEALPLLDERIDYILQEGKMESAYISALTAHTDYWNNPDIGLFVLTMLFPKYAPHSSRLTRTNNVHFFI